MQRVGSRAQVMHGNAKMTGGGLRKKDLKYNKQGKIVSKKMSKLAKKEKRLQKAGYTTRKGQFGAVRSMKGGASEINMLTWNMDGNRGNSLEFHIDPSSENQDLMTEFVKKCIEGTFIGTKNIDAASSIERNFKRNNKNRNNDIQKLHPGENIALIDEDIKSTLDSFIQNAVIILTKMESNKNLTNTKLMSKVNLILLYFTYLCCCIYMKYGKEDTAIKTLSDKRDEINKEINERFKEIITSDNNKKGNLRFMLPSDSNNNSNSNSGYWVSGRVMEYKNSNRDNIGTFVEVENKNFNFKKKYVFEYRNKNETKYSEIIDFTQKPIHLKLVDKTYSLQNDKIWMDTLIKQYLLLILRHINNVYTNDYYDKNIHNNTKNSKLSNTDKNTLKTMINNIIEASSDTRVEDLTDNLNTMLIRNNIDFACLQECVDYEDEVSIANDKYKVIIRKPGNEWILPEDDIELNIDRDIKNACEINHYSDSNSPSIAIVYDTRKYKTPIIKCYIPHVIKNSNEADGASQTYESILIVDFTRIFDNEVIRVASAHLKSTGDRKNNYIIAHKVLSSCNLVGMDCNNKGQWKSCEDEVNDTKTLGCDRKAIIGLEKLKGTVFQTSLPYGKSTRKRRTPFQTQLDKLDNVDDSCKDLSMINKNNLEKIIGTDTCTMVGRTIPELLDGGMTPSSGLVFNLYPSENVHKIRPWGSDHCAVITTINATPINATPIKYSGILLNSDTMYFK